MLICYNYIKIIERKGNMYMIRNIFKTFSVIFCILIFSTVTFGADPIYVKINNVKVEYEDSKPQIIKQRAMVPIRETAEKLGASIDWNKDTETMTIKKGDRTVIHTFRTRVITINGKAVTFDTPSTVLNDRTMMPVRMLSESLGNAVGWDNTTRTVNIVATEPQIIGVVPDKTSLSSGETINIVVTANENTDKIKIVDVNNNSALITESSTYVKASNGNKTFSLPYTPNEQKSSFKTLKVIAGGVNSYNEENNGYKVLALNISVQEKPKILSFKSNKTEIARGNEIEFTIEANSLTQRVKISTIESPKLLEISKFVLKEDDKNIRIFKVKRKIEDRGDIEFRAYASNNSNDYSNEYEKILINVGGEGSGSDGSQILNIRDIYVLDTEAYVNQKTKIVVKTSSDIERIEIRDKDDKVIENTRYPAIENKSTLVWELSVPIVDSGRNALTLVAYNEDDKKVTQDFSINAYSYNADKLNILSVEQTDIGATTGSTVRFYINTTYSVNSIKILDGSNTILETKDYSTSGNNKQFRVEFKVDSYNKDSLRVVAIGNNDTQTSRKINVYLNAQSEGTIHDYEILTPEVYKNEYIRLNVYTNEAISKVWIEDYNDVTVFRTKEFNGVSGDEYTWQVKFPADEIGSNIRYTIYAEDESGKVYEETFRIRVNK